MKIFGSNVNWTRDSRPRWVLNELGVAFDREDANVFGKDKPAELLDVNPLGLVPVLIDGDVRIFESGALVLYLAETYGGDKLVPPQASPARALYYQWSLFAATTLEPVSVQLLVNGFFRKEAEGAAQRIADAKKKFQTLAPVLERVLDRSRYILGDTFSAADIMVGTSLNWARMGMGMSLADHPVLESYFGRLSERPAFKATFSS